MNGSETMDTPLQNSDTNKDSICLTLYSLEDDYDREFKRKLNELFDDYYGAVAKG